MRNNDDLVRKLTEAGVRPTRQRTALAGLIFARPCRHLTAESLMEEAQASGLQISLATIYNNLNQFSHAGLLREIIIAPGRSCYDTDTSHHHHFYDCDTGAITDIPADHIAIAALPEPPDNHEIDRVDIVIRTRKSNYSKSSCG